MARLWNPRRRAAPSGEGGPGSPAPPAGIRPKGWGAEEAGSRGGEA